MRLSTATSTPASSDATIVTIARSLPDYAVDTSRACNHLPPVNPDIHAELAAALRDRLSIVADRVAYERDAALHLEQLKQVSERIEILERQLPTPVDPQLRHFLDRRSYDKALAYLDGDIPPLNS